MGVRSIYRQKRLVHRGRHRKIRPKTFSSEEKAKAWAQAQGLKTFGVVRLNAGLSRKFKIVSKK